ncbi:hypothetical protein EWB00_005103 [Schistosoma japonicum]|uniref:Uncharacterized protein n=1 Tax=Schistosoma japonicum TaxID=6182 RepID=A0A4Z2DUE9_SCHJA|nr:hypothetical protein EWB00_005103 [Schistosoma japonicum]TNN20157.1 hypothetical protein EWB00_005103 [Schistosoma japonicum]
MVYFSGLNRKFTSNYPLITEEKSLELVSEAGIIWLYNYYFTIDDNVNDSSFISSNESYFKTLNYSIQFVNSCNPGLIMNNTNYISNNDTGIYSSNVYPSTSVNQVNHSTMIQL